MNELTSLVKYILIVLIFSIYSCTTEDILPPPDIDEDKGNYLVENFDYPAGEELTNHGWFAHSAAATNPIVVSSSGLNWVMSPYIGSGVGNAALVNNTGQDINKPLKEFFTSGNVYASFLFKANSPVQSGGEGFFFHLGRYDNVDNPDLTNLSSAFRARTYVLRGTNPDKDFKLGLAFNATTASETTGDFDLSQTYLVVVKYSFVDGDDNDTVSLYVFADGDDITSEPNTPDIGPLTGSAADIGTLQVVALRQYNAVQDVTVDGIYVRTVWNMTDPSIP